MPLATDQHGRQIDCEADLDHCRVRFYVFPSKSITDSEFPSVFTIFAMYECVLENKMIVGKNKKTNQKPTKPSLKTFSQIFKNKTSIGKKNKKTKQKTLKGFLIA